MTEAALAVRGPGEVIVAVEVAASAAEVFAAMTDWPRQSQWVALTTVRVAAGDGRSAGSRIEAFTGIGRLGFLDLMTITSWNPPFQVDVLHTGRVVRGPGMMRVTELSDSHAL